MRRRSFNLARTSASSVSARRLACAPWAPSSSLPGHEAAVDLELAHRQEMQVRRVRRAKHQRAVVTPGCNDSDPPNVKEAGTASGELVHPRKTALVTGSTSGIGLAIATELASRGMNLVLNGFGDGADIELLRSGLGQAHGVDVLYDGADMSRQEAIEAMLARTTTHFGGIDVLVNNAGIQHVAPVDEFPVEKWNAILAINLTAAFHTTRLALPHMKFNGWGRIVNVASAHALVASPYKSRPMSRPSTVSPASPRPWRWNAAATPHPSTHRP